jgi:8-oxo-dGTP diphosphatase
VTAPFADEVRAAGGVVVRDGRIAVVHRPRYDDWSLPKGKLDPGESWEEAAVREVREETALGCRIVGELEPVRYPDRKGRPKTVRYYRMEVVEDGVFVAGHEVDDLAWWPLERAARELTYPHDRALVSSIG